MSWSDWIRTVEIEAAVDAADPALLAVQVDALLRAGCRVFAIELEPGLARLSVIAELSPLLRAYGAVLDARLLGEADAEACGALAAAGADSVTIQLERVADPAGLLAAARAVGLQTGIAFDAGTGVASAVAAAADADLVRCPDGELPFDERLETVRALCASLPLGCVVQVGGEVDADNVLPYYEAGARLLVVGRAIFAREDLPRAYRRLVAALA